MKPQPPCPECEKLAKVSEESNKIGAFLNWMISEKDLVIAEWGEGDDLWRSSFNSDYGINRLLAEYYEINLNEVENERRALLDWIREVQGGNE